MREANWTFLVGYLHHSGERYGSLSNTEQAYVRSHGDGFGETTDPDLLWDWSHVRDSSPPAVSAMAGALRRLGYKECLTCGGSEYVTHREGLVAVPCPGCFVEGEEAA